MAKIRILITDDEDGRAVVEFIPDPDFEGDDDDLTDAQHLAMRVIEFVELEALAANGEGMFLQ